MDMTDGVARTHHVRHCYTRTGDSDSIKYESLADLSHSTKERTDSPDCLTHVTDKMTGPTKVRP